MQKKTLGLQSGFLHDHTITSPLVNQLALPSWVVLDVEHYGGPFLSFVCSKFLFDNPLMPPVRLTTAYKFTQTRMARWFSSSAEGNFWQLEASIHPMRSPLVVCLAASKTMECTVGREGDIFGKHNREKIEQIESNVHFNFHSSCPTQRERRLRYSTSILLARNSWSLF